MMNELRKHLAGLETSVIRESRPARVSIVFLHGYGMRPADLTSFAHSLAIPGAAFFFPQAPLAAACADGYAWWQIEASTRSAGLPSAARDLAHYNPPGRAAARTLIGELLSAVRAQSDGEPLVLAGFSQGGMLACDTLLMNDVPVSALVTMSASRIAADEWHARRAKLQGVRAFVSHGRWDNDLAFTAGEALKEFMRAGGAQVTWLPFDGGHTIPFPVWREFRRFAHEIADANTRDSARGTAQLAALNARYGTR